ncbi:uncharacterized protein TNIN_446111 [Trichonephila inaurata madagascariensis]|uniref:Uncharacterized protein n=1 Tax=Trichonephila inaurata madagascariensis TaxID=2747483 RepID=A0A8X6X4Z3_9ARAC|nr:uncharacterized protein TNIN_446111 [Trichonephila inaurata madagascariensis]
MLTYIIGLILLFRTTGYVAILQRSNQTLKIVSKRYNRCLTRFSEDTVQEKTTLLISFRVVHLPSAQNELWWHGPPWLKLTPDHWPNRHRDILDSELCSEELEHHSSEHVAVAQQRESLVDINRFALRKS